MILLGNNLLNTALATLVAVIVAMLFGHDDLALFLGSIAVTFAILIFSEITPKVIAAAYPERIALTASYVLTPLLIICYPIVWFVNLFVRGLLILFRLNPERNELEQKISIEELKTLVLEGGHFIQHKHQSMLLNLFDLETITVDDVMVPRSQVEAIDMSDNDETIQTQLLTCHHTRLPVYRERVDNIIGIIHVRKILNQMQNGKITVETLLRKSFINLTSFLLGHLCFLNCNYSVKNQRRIGLVVMNMVNGWDW